MEIITSQDNQIYKLCRKLAQKKYRDRMGRYLIEGDNLLQEAIKCGQKIEQVIFHEDYDGPVKASGNRFVFMKGSLFERAAQTETSQGVLAIVEKCEPEADEFFEKAETVGTNIVVLDRLQDPGNIGTIIRTADAAGYGGVMCIKGTGDVYSPKVVRAAAGSLFRVPVMIAGSAEEAVRLLKDHGKRILVTCFDTENWYYEQDMAQNTALVIGNEGNGISEELIGLADCKIKIPMQGSIDSLNAAVAAGILMYQSSQQLRKK